MRKSTVCSLHFSPFAVCSLYFTLTTLNNNNLNENCRPHLTPSLKSHFCSPQSAFCSTWSPYGHPVNTTTSLLSPLWIVRVVIINSFFNWFFLKTGIINCIDFCILIVVIKEFFCEFDCYKLQMSIDINQQLAIFMLETCYPSGQSWANICSPSGYASLV